MVTVTPPCTTARYKGKKRRLSFVWPWRVPIWPSEENYCSGGTPRVRRVEFLRRAVLQDHPRRTIDVCVQQTESSGSLEREQSVSVHNGG